MIVNMKSIAVLEPRLYLPAPSNLFSVRKLSCFPLTSLPSKFVRLKAIANPTCDDQESDRPFKKLPPSPWTDRFHSLSIDVLEMDALRKEIEVLKGKVMNTLMSSQGIDSAKNKILTIYLLVSLGLAYHFEDEIDETLVESFEKIEEIMAGEEDLYTVSIIFWVFRRYAHHISSDVFRRFKGNNGKFKQSLIGDVKGMLSLYEAAHLGTTKDYIMHEALSFTSSHLESLAIGETCPPHLAKRIQNALILPQHWNMDVIVPMEYISFYEQEKDHNQMLLKFAKLNFKFLQLQYIQELKSVTKWYKEHDFASKFPPYFRDRIVENYFFVLSVFFEPQKSRGRRIVTQCFTALQILDDTFDRYASLPEAESFAKSLIRWAPDNTMDKQPAYLKSALNSILDIFEELRNEHRPEGGSYSVDATIDEFKESARENFDLAKWALVGHVPSFEEYMEVGALEIQGCSTLASILLGIGKMGTKEAYEWLKSRPKLVQSLSIKGRLRNDITGFEDDMSRGYVTNAVNCYMKQYGVSKEEAFRELNKIVADGDKIINEEFLTTTGVPRCVLRAAVDFARMITVTYNVNDGFTDPRGKIEEYMTFLFVDQIRL